MNWNLKVRVVRFWTTPDKYKPDIPYSMELILQDEKNTIVTKLEDSSFHMDVFKLCTFDEVAIQHNTDENQLIGEYEKVSQTSSQQHISISEELSTGMVSFKFIKDFLQCTEESTYWIAVKIVCLELGHKWSYLACKKCITKVDPMGDKYYCLKCNVEVISVIHRYRLQIHVTDETGFISLLLWNKEVLQLIGKTAKELKEGLIGDADNGYPTELDTLIEKKLMFKVQIKDSNINKNDNVYKVVKFIDDEALLKEYCHPSLIHSLTTPIKNSISDCVSSQTEDVIDLTEKLYPNNGKQVGVRPTHADDEGLNVKLPSNKLRKVIKKGKKA
ncbi:hypothetical protein KY284_030374 [Solanum tuberosum]|nr:hypothetical protein KY284_030374 [Solanum tuberosum]